MFLPTGYHPSPCISHPCGMLDGWMVRPCQRVMSLSTGCHPSLWGFHPCRDDGIGGANGLYPSLWGSHPLRDDGGEEYRSKRRGVL